jgi:protein-S-isoprenylcysteine O-methyltransferase Ste14
VAGGPYRYSRNPMYLGVLAAILGWLLAFQTAALLIYGLAVAAAFNLFVIGYEEPHLRRLFGAEYDAYRRRVPRWLPCLRPAAMTDDSGAA